MPVPNAKFLAISTASLGFCLEASPDLAPEVYARVREEDPGTLNGMLLTGAGLEALIKEIEKLVNMGIIDQKGRLLDSHTGEVFVPDDN